MKAMKVDDTPTHPSYTRITPHFLLITHHSSLIAHRSSLITDHVIFITHHYPSLEQLPGAGAVLKISPPLKALADAVEALVGAVYIDSKVGHIEIYMGG